MPAIVCPECGARREPPSFLHAHDCILCPACGANPFTEEWVWAVVPRILYDDGCSVCRFLARAVTRLARTTRRQLELVPLRSDAARADLAEFYDGDAPWDFYLREGDTLARGRAAILPILRAAIWGRAWWDPGTRTTT